MRRSLSDLLQNSSIAEEDILDAITNSHEEVRKVDHYGGLPIHIECKYQCRLPILSKCIELYPESISVGAGRCKKVPLHVAMTSNSSSSVDSVLYLLGKYPDALQIKDINGNLPIHIECRYHCKLPVISKCIEVYPESLTIADNFGCLPLHRVLANPASSTAVALFMIEKDPETLRHGTLRDQLPIHVECQKQCRSSVISRCIQLYPESLSKCSTSGSLPLTRALCKVTYENIHQKRKSLGILLSSHPASFYHPPDDPMIDKFYMMRDPLCRRLILNLYPSCLSSAAHLQAYHDLNWEPRCSLLHLWIQLCMRVRQQGLISAEKLIKDACLFPSMLAHAESSCQVKMLELMTKILELSVGFSIRSDRCEDSKMVRCAAICQGDDLGDHWLRAIVIYL
jgi:hypothetical protein